MRQRRRSALGVVGACALTAPFLLASPALAIAPAGSTVFVDELHYDNAGADTGEFVEVANPGGADLTGWTVVLYNGNNGGSYGTFPLSGTAGFTVVDTPGLQNGSPDGLALVRPDGTVEQFLSYEGSFAATNGPASGLTSTDIGVAEGSDTPAGFSLQLTGSTGAYGSGTWQAPAAETRGAANGGGNGGGGGDPVEPGAVTPISAVQGSGSASPLVGQTVTVQAVVTTLITRNDVTDGFFVQSRDADADSDAATSEGLYVYCRAVCSPDLAAGDLVRATGTVGEFFTSTQLDVTSGLVSVSATGQARPTPATVTLPAATGTDQETTFEPQEGMLTTVSTPLALSEYFNLARFGQLGLTAQTRPYQFTETTTPSDAGYQAFLADLAKKRLLLDDTSDDQNDATSGPQDNEPYPFPTPGLSLDNAFRGGDTITDLTGVMAYNFGQWELRAAPGEDYTFASVNPRPAAPEAVGGRLKVASVNVLNSFATIDETSSNSSGPCGPNGGLDCRGADSAAERERQLAKTTAELTGLDADVLGLVEVQNDGGVTTAEIVGALNATAGAGTYASIDTGTIGTDAIKVALVYKPAKVTPAGAFKVLDSSVDPAFIDTKNRPALVQTFDEVGTGERFTVAVNHLKSKGSGCGAGDDATDGSGNCDGTRTAAAQALARFLATDPTGSGDPDVLVIGDLNAYSAERPISALTGAGFTDLAKAYEGPSSYSYLFDGQLGSLDHALANTSLSTQVTGTTTWHVNADESPLLDYNDDVRDAGEASFERESSALPLFAPDAYRSSDHDPLLVGLSLGSDTPAATPFTLTLLHNNDGESSLLPAAPRGGIARFGTIVKDLRSQAAAEGSSSLLVSSGDNYLAGPVLQASLENYDGDTDYSNDGPFYDAVGLDHLGYDASAIGNHEFDFGPKVLGYFLSQFKESNIRFVSANLDVTGEPALEQFVKTPPGEAGSLVEWTRTVKDGHKIAIVGATTPRLASITSPGPNVQARDNVREAVQAAIEAATADGTNVVVLLSHLQNITEDKALIASLKDLDLAVAGGGDDLLANPGDVLLPGSPAPSGPYPLLATDADGAQVPIVTTEGSYGYVGRLIVNLDAAGAVTSVDSRSGPVRNVFDANNPPADQATPDPYLLSKVEQPVAAFVAGLKAQDVATTTVKLDGLTPSVRTKETNLGDLFADALRRTAEKGAPGVFGASNPTVAIQNGGGIRNSLVLGPDVNGGRITRFDTFQIAPFTNFVGYTTGVTPTKLKTLLERSVSAGATDGKLQAEGRFGQWSGLRFVYDPSQPAQVVSRAADGTVSITTPGQRVRQVFLTLNTPSTADDVQVVRNGVVVSGQAVDLAANSFTVGQNGDNYPFNLTEGQFVNLPTTYQQSLEDRFRELGTVTAADYPEGGLGRITVGGDVNAPVTGPVVPKGRLLVTGLTTDSAQRVVQFQTGDPRGSRTPGVVLSGFTGGDTRLVGIDYRVANGLLYGVGNQGGLYTVDVASGRLALDRRLSVALSGSAFGVDVNPAADALRIVSNTGQNLRQPFAAGAATVVDGMLTYGDGPAQGISGAAYTNNDADPATGTQLFVGDSRRNTIDLQSPANAGTLSVLGGTRLPFEVMGDLDVYTYPSGTNVAFGVGRTSRSDFHLVAVDLATGRARDIGLAPGIEDLAIPTVQP